MDFKELLKQIAASYGWGIVYARRDYQNLQEIVDHINAEAENYSEGETFFFVDPVTRKPHDTGYTYSGRFMVLTNSDLSDDYNTKYDNYIAPVIDKVMREMVQKLRCHGDVEAWQSIEVINALDINGDGLSVTYQWKGEGFPKVVLPAYMEILGAPGYTADIIIQEEGLAGQIVTTSIVNGKGLITFDPAGGPTGFKEGINYVSISPGSWDGKSWAATLPELPFRMYIGKGIRITLEETEGGGE